MRLGAHSMDRSRSNSTGSPPVPQICDQQREIIRFKPSHEVATAGRQALTSVLKTVRTLGKPTAFSCFKPGYRSLSLHAL